MKAHKKNGKMEYIKVIKEELRREEFMYRGLFEHMPSGVAIYRPVDGERDFVFVDFNAAAERIDKIKKIRIIGRRVSKVFPGVEKMGLLKVFRRVYRSGKAEYLPAAVYKDRRITGWRENWVYKLPSGDLVSIYNDTTYRKAAEEELLKKERQYRDLFDDAADCVLIADARTTGFCAANLAAVKALGYSRKDILNMSVKDIHPRSELKWVSKIFMDMSRGKVFLARDIPVRRKDGSVFYADIHMSRVIFEDKQCLLGFFRDITERKYAEEALKEREALLNEVGDIARIGGWEMDLKTGKATWTKGTYDIAEIDYGKPIPGLREHISYYIPEYRGMIKKKMKKLIQTGQPMQFEAAAKTAKGRIIWCQVFGKAVVNGGRAVKVKGTIQDISERKRAEDELKRAYNELRDTQAQLIQSNKMSALGQLASGVAHELNNPLTGVLNNVQLIKMEAREKKDFSMRDFKELLDSIETSAARCQWIAQSLLEFTHVSKNKFEPVSLNELVKKTLLLVSQELKLHHIKFSEKLEPGLPKVSGDPQLLQQVIYGLIVNAKWAIDKKSKRGGRIEIETRFSPRQKLAKVSVADTGIGISKENMLKLFTPFFTTKEVGEGTGLGLSLFYNIIKNHKGSIAVESRANIGTKFIITIPY